MPTAYSKARYILLRSPIEDPERIHILQIEVLPAPPAYAAPYHRKLTLAAPENYLAMSHCYSYIKHIFESAASSVRLYLRC